MSTSRYNVAQARKDRSAAVSHPFYPLALFLLKESITNSIRFGASIFNISFTWNEAFQAWKVETQDDGSGDADFDRMNGPAEENGETTSRYGFGDWARQVFGDASNELPASRIAKKAGDEYALSIITGPIPNKWDPRDLYYMDPKCPFESVESHGFYNMNHIHMDAIPGIGADDLLAVFREIVTVGFDQEILDKLNIIVAINGETVSNSHDPKWDSYETALMKKAGITVTNDGVTTKTAGDVKLTVHKLRQIGTGLIPNFPNYGKRSMDTSLAFFFQGGILIEEQPVYQAIGLAQHPTSQNGCKAFVRLELTDPSLPATSLPTPASTKTSYIPTCPVYMACMAELAKVRDTKWITPKPRAPALPPTPEEKKKAKADADAKKAQAKKAEAEAIAKKAEAEAKKSARPSLAARKAEANIPDAGQQTFPQDLGVFAVQDAPASVTSEEQVDVPVADINPRSELLADVRASLRVFLDKVKRLSTEEFNLGLDGLEDWLENGNGEL